MKLLNKKSFIMLTVGFFAYWANYIISIILSLRNLDNVIADQFALSAEIFEEAGITEDVIKNITLTILFISAALIIGLSLIFYIKALNHRKKPKTGSYLTVLMVFCFIFIGFAVFSVMKDPLVLINIAIYVLMIAAVFMQRSSNVPFADQIVNTNYVGYQPYDQMYQQGNPNQQGYNPNQQGYYNPNQQGYNPYVQPNQQPQSPFDELNKNQNNNNNGNN